MSWLHTYWQEVRGNVYAIVPCGLVAWAWLRAKHESLKVAHAQHNAQLQRILEHLDPDAQTDGLLDEIADRVDETTPHGLGAIRADLHQILQLPGGLDALPPLRRPPGGTNQKGKP